MAENPILKKSVSVRGKRKSLFKCPHCDVTSHSSPGIKGHITKKHAELRNMMNDNKNNKTVHNKIPNLKESLRKDKVLDVLDHLLIEVIEISDDEITLREENCEIIEEMNVKKYVNDCDRCDYKVVDTKKYGVVQKLLKHKKTNHENKVQVKCEECDFKPKDKMQLKRHMRDKHEENNASTSPPPKRKRSKSETKEDMVEDMDVDKRQ